MLMGKVVAGLTCFANTVWGRFCFTHLTSQMRVLPARMPGSVFKPEHRFAGLWLSCFKGDA